MEPELDRTDLRAYFPEPTQTKIFNEELWLQDEYEKERGHGFAFRIQRILGQIGVPPRLHRAVLDTVPPVIRNKRVYEAFPARSFGMTGPGGCGKSAAIVVGIKKKLEADSITFGPDQMVPSDNGMQGIFTRKSFEPRENWIWINWPATAVEMKQLASRREWTNPAASLLPIMEQLKARPEKTIVILDDFGMENIKGEKAYVQEQLELLVDVAYNWEARVFWTSNHSFEALADERLYGYRMMSRMAGLAPDLKLPEELPDLRARSANEKA